MTTDDTRLADPGFAPRPNPLANVLKTGTDADCPRVPEDAAAVNSRTLRWYRGFAPQDYFHCWVVEQVSVTTLRIERAARIERRARDRVVLRAELF